MTQAKIYFHTEPTICYLYSINIVPKITIVNHQIHQENEYIVIYSTDGKCLEEARINELEDIEIINQ